jgi:putative photosynthetic complex assembly protein 2
MSEHVVAVLFAVLLWWSTTAIAVHLNGLPRHTFPWTFAASTALMLGALAVMHQFAADTTVGGAYIAFACGLLYWAWQDVSFYLGIVTGRRKERCPEGCSGWAHFGHAIDASLYHELAILAAAAVVFVVMWGSPNDLGLWTFCVLWWMHQSAKLNVFLGVTNLNTDFLPEHLRFLEGYFRKRAMNLLFPISITVSTLSAAWLAVEAARAPSGTFEAVAYTLLATLMVLALLEHWFLVLPLPFEKLWKWAIVRQNGAPGCRIEIVSGNLGAGKTTYIKGMLDARDGERTVVIANDFADLGVDASLLADRGADVIELPNGCICCSLSNDLAAELSTVFARFHPRRLLIEPSGIADVGALTEVVARPGLVPQGSSIFVHGIFDASCFLNDYSKDSRRLELQARIADRIVINKADVVDGTTLEIVATTLRRAAPHAEIATAAFGMILQAHGDTRDTTAPALAAARPAAVFRSAVAYGRPHADHGNGHRDGHHDDLGHVHQHSHGLALQSWSATLACTCGVEEIRSVLSSVVSGRYGAVERLKGIAQTNAGWVAFDIAGGRSHIAAFAPGERERPRVMAIGTNVDTASLAMAFGACRTEDRGTAIAI